MSDLVNHTLANRYYVSSFIGKGGMAGVYKVWDKSRRVNLALKILHPRFAGNSTLLDHFRTEASTLANLQHPKIVRFYSFERDGNVAFIVMDYVEGITLREEIRSRNVIEPRRISQIMQDVCAALSYAHELGYVHCDMKPANIMINRNGDALVADFGIARLAGGIHESGLAGGTPGYMSPEQIRGEKPTPASDIYALGVVLYEMLTGVRPYTDKSDRVEGGNSESIRWEQIHLPPPSPRMYNPAIPPDVEAVVLRCLEKNPARRYSSMQRLINALEGPLLAMAEKSSGPAPERENDVSEAVPGSKPTGRDQRQRKVWIWSIAAVSIIFLIVLVGGGGGGGTPIQPPLDSGVESFPTMPVPISLDTPSPSFSIRPFNPSTDQNIDCIKCRFPDWEEPTEPGTYEWEVTYPYNAPVRILLGWCALDQMTLDENWQSLEFEMIVDGVLIDLNELNFETFVTPSNNPCYGYSGVLTGWSRGQHQYIEIHRFIRSLDDGWTTYEAGVYEEGFTVNVK